MAGTLRQAPSRKKALIHMSDLDVAKMKLSEMVKAMNPEIMCKIPEETANGLFQITVTSKGKTFCLPLSEDDLFDFVEDPSRMKEIRGTIEQLLRDLKA
jgi:hypothetical protein